MFSCYFTETTAAIVNYLSLPFQFFIVPETTMKVTTDTVTVSELFGGRKGQTVVQLKDADPNELQLFIDKMPTTIEGKSLKYD